MTNAPNYKKKNTALKTVCVTVAVGLGNGDWPRKFFSPNIFFALYPWILCAIFLQYRLIMTLKYGICKSIYCSFSSVSRNVVNTPVMYEKKEYKYCHYTVKPVSFRKYQWYTFLVIPPSTKRFHSKTNSTEIKYWGIWWKPTVRDN